MKQENKYNLTAEQLAVFKKYNYPIEEVGGMSPEKIELGILLKLKKNSLEIKQIMGKMRYLIALDEV